MIPQEGEHVGSWLVGFDTAVLCLKPLLVEHIALNLRGEIEFVDLRLQFFSGVVAVARWLDRVAIAGGVDGAVLVDCILKCRDGIDQPFDFLPVDIGSSADLREPVGVAPQSGDGVWAVLAAVGVEAEPVVVRKEVGVALDVGDDGLLVGHRVRLLQEGVTRVVVVDDLEGLPEAVTVLLALALVVHPPPPVWVALLEPAVGDELVHLVVVDNPVPDRVRIEAKPFGEVAGLCGWLVQLFGLAFRFESVVSHESLSSVLSIL
ncbi:MAG: hypothetical protein A07HN63_00476 [uncultured archaeon A07HN63]|nr:MAG: hypothetical protein A07HN63_00476 [uncultured archaeon A07HN63]